MEILEAAVVHAHPLLGQIGFAELPWWGNSLIALWLWCFGANVGSFMNVVVFRVPAGRSVVHPRSQCPKCQHAIRWYDNIPVLSWLILRARCRDCGVPISGRYPTIEATVAATFLVLAFLEPIALGKNLPELTVMPPLRLANMPMLWLMYAYQLLLWCTLFCAALIRFDGHRPPFRLFLPALLIGLTAPIVWSNLRPIAFHAPFQTAPWLMGILDGLIGIAAGASLGILIERVARPRAGRAWSGIMPYALAGLFLGWQAASAIACLTMGVHLFVSLGARRWPACERVSTAAYLVVASVLYIVFWRQIIHVPPGLGAQATPAVFVVAVVVASGLSLLASFIMPAPASCGVRDPVDMGTETQELDL